MSSVFLCYNYIRFCKVKQKHRKIKIFLGKFGSIIYSIGEHMCILCIYGMRGESGRFAEQIWRFIESFCEDKEISLPLHHQNKKVSFFMHRFFIS